MWKKTQEYVDLELGHHVIRLRNEHSGAEHLVQIVLGHDACPHCGVVKAKDNLGEHDPAVHVERVLAELNRSHEQMLAYAKQHGVAVRGAR